jgi:ribosomal protein S18 acetylase RimI-like enzyme
MTSDRPGSRTMPTLRPMSQAEYDAWIEQSIKDYAADKVASGQWAESEALELSRQENDELLPQGRRTPDNHFFTIVDARSQAVGMLWFAIKRKFDAPAAYVYDVAVWPEHQRQGHATRAFQALEGEVRRLGLHGVALHVFGHNTGAQALYAKLGYSPTSISLYKPIPATAGPGPEPGDST